MKRILAAAFLLLLILAVAVSCKEEDTPDKPDDSLRVFMSDSASDYTIVYPKRYTTSASASEGGEALSYFEELLKKNVGSFWEIKSDYMESGTDSSAFDGAKEILLGNTNRKESALAAEGLREKDYVIKIVDGKLVVIGGSDEASAAAIRQFAAMFFGEPQDALILRNSYVYENRYDYALDSLTIGGTPLKDFTIVYSKGANRDANYLQNALRETVGYTLPVSSDPEGKENKILISSSTDAGCFASLAGSTLTLSGDTASSRNLAVVRFLDTLTSSDKKEVSIDEDFSIDSKISGGLPLSVFDLNLYSTGYGENSVNNRYPRLMTLVEKYKPAILTLQEVSASWLSAMKEGRGGASPLTDRYDFVGIGRNNDEESVRHAIFYDKSLFTVKDSGTFWLSETPDWESVGWDGRTRSICTWAILTEKTTGREFAVMNTQLDPYGNIAQREGCALLAERAKAFGLPVILAGDMNRAGTIPSIKDQKSYFFADSADLAATVGKKGLTVNNAFGAEEKFTSACDFVFTSFGEFCVESYTLVDERVEGKYVSNHWPILTKLILN